jgi:hypothetical protein
MDKVSGFFDDFPTPSLIESTARLFENETAFKYFREKYPDMDENTIKNSRGRIYAMIREFNNCAVCMSYESCKNCFHGHYLALDVKQFDDIGYFIGDVLKPCKKFKGYNTVH